ncbi:MAG: hypothetical protein ACYDAR_11200 [Thermomicrobiales bacterium]
MHETITGNRRYVEAAESNDAATFRPFVALAPYGGDIGRMLTVGEESLAEEAERQ